MAQYLAVPEGNGRHPGVVLVHEWWGVNEQIKSIADRWAKEGFVCFVPDLFNDKIAANATEAEAMMNSLDYPAAVEKIEAAVATLKVDSRCTEKVALTGYCMGGALTFLAATMVPGLAAVVPFYGVPGNADWSKIDAPVMAHFATRDDWATVDAGMKIKEAIDKVSSMDLHLYDADHAFCNDRRPEVYNPSACAQAWDRTVTFVRRLTA
ncbi:MAG: dienelactone hydrolase family protein [Kofleriaceae bacterium]|nr:dienelactone hydrolase family protein [Kofleriaceae bacterium]